ncbi:MAG: SCP-like extracellular [Aquificaceae bacterium]|nr:MAG: SCP-like extracellular [Aquificaceae bacterium]
MYKAILLFLSLFLIFGCSTNPPQQSIPQEPFTPSSGGAEPVKFRGTLASHNSVRAQLGLVPLRWSNKLARYAQQWANHQAQTQNCAMQHRPHQAGPFQQVHGENLFWASPKHWSDGKTELQEISIGEVVKAWADEVVDYDYNSNSCREGEQCGHYTQIVWHETRAVGCAIAVCPDQSQLWVCNYDPPGNYIGEKPY